MSAKDNKEENKNIDVERLDVEQQVVVAKYCTLFRVPEGKNINEAHHYKVMDNTLMVKWNKDDDFQEIELGQSSHGKNFIFFQPQFVAPLLRSRHVFFRCF